MNERENKAIAHFNRGEYLEAHELFETIWLKSAGEQKNYLQGVIQVGAGIIKIRLQPNVPATIRLLHKGIGRLRDVDQKQCPIDIGRLIDDSMKLLRQLEDGDKGPVRDSENFDLPLLSLIP